MRHRLLPILLLSILPMYAQAQAVYPTVGKAEQKARDDDRRVILQDELGAEKESLAKAQAQFDAGPTTEREADVHRHVENVKALQRELDGSAGQHVTHEPAHVVVKATRATLNTEPASTRSAARFWDPYNRAPETDFSTVPRRNSHE
jgi:hypothetical protein